MINYPILDTTIGIIFIFLLYSLLATTISEALATKLALRARMLRKGIIKGMLSNTICPGESIFFQEWRARLRLYWNYFSNRKKDPDCKTNTWGSLYQAIRNFFHAFWRILSGDAYDYKKLTLGGDFYLHPIIKNYGASRRYSVPSYIPKSTFSTVLIDVLERYYLAYRLDIDKTYELKGAGNDMSKITKIQYLLDFLTLPPIDRKHFPDNLPRPVIDAETVLILQLHLRESKYNLLQFKLVLESWYDDTMNRVSGWYKRQGQSILFVLGLLMAVAFNVDIISIAGKLSTDKDARAKLVTMAQSAADEYKDDARVKRLDKAILATDPNQKRTIDSLADEKQNAKQSYDQQRKKAEAMLKTDIEDANNLLALGWADYGRKRDSLEYLERYKPEYSKISGEIQANDLALCHAIQDSSALLLQKLREEPVPDQTEITALERRMFQQDSLYRDQSERLPQRAFEALFAEKQYQIKLGYVLSEMWKGRRPLSFLLFGFGICLGAPLWFDLLQKLIRIRGAGKKETTETAASEKSPSVQPTNITVHANKNEKGAVG